MTPTTALTSSLLHPQSESAAVPTNISSLTLTSIMACDYWSISITNNFTVDLAYITVFNSVRPSTPFSADTDTPIFCCHSNTIPIRYRFFDTLQERTWRRVTDRSKAPDAAAAATNNSGTPRTRCSAAADAFNLSWTVKHSNYQ